MFDFFRKNVLALFIVAGLLAAIIVYSLNLPDRNEANLLEKGVGATLAPLQSQVNGGGSIITRIWHNYIDLVNVKRENKRLNKDIKQLNQTLATAGEAIRENERLVRLLELRKAVSEPTIAASVIGEDVTPWFRTLAIDKGSSSGIREGMPVLAAGGVLGQAIKVTGNTSRVLLITDHASGVSAMVQRSRARGVVKGKGENLCALQFTMRDEDVAVGDLVVTSGIGGVFPKGIPVGTVTMVKKGQYGIFQTVNLRPAVNSANLEEVLVVLRAPLE